MWYKIQDLLFTAWSEMIPSIWSTFSDRFLTSSNSLESNWCLDGFITRSLWSIVLNDFHNVSVTPLTFCLEWWSSGCRTDWISHTYRDKVHLSPDLPSVRHLLDYTEQDAVCFHRRPAFVQWEASKWKQGGDDFSQCANGLRLLSFKNNQQSEQPNHHQR